VHSLFILLYIAFTCITTLCFNPSSSSSSSAFLASQLRSFLFSLLSVSVLIVKEGMCDDDTEEKHNFAGQRDYPDGYMNVP